MCSPTLLKALKRRATESKGSLAVILLWLFFEVILLPALIGEFSAQRDMVVQSCVYDGYAKQVLAPDNLTVVWECTICIPDVTVYDKGFVAPSLPPNSNVSANTVCQTYSGRTEVCYLPSFCMLWPPVSPSIYRMYEDRWLYWQQSDFPGFLSGILIGVIAMLTLGCLIFRRKRNTVVTKKQVAGFMSTRTATALGIMTTIIAVLQIFVYMLQMRLWASLLSIMELAFLLVLIWAQELKPSDVSALGKTVTPTSPTSQDRLAALEESIRLEGLDSMVAESNRLGQKRPYRDTEK